MVKKAGTTGSPNHRTFNEKRYVWYDEAFHKEDAEKKKARVQKRGWHVRIVKTPDRWNPHMRTLYIRKK